jgi:hypothetical protein
MSSEGGSKAPFVVYGGIFFIGLACVSAVLIYDCQREAPYQDAEKVRPGDPPPASLPPPPDRPRPK